MKVYLATSYVGIFTLNEEGNVINVHYFDLDPEKTSKILVNLDNGNFSSETLKMLKQHKDDEIYLQQPTLGRALKDMGFKIVSSHENVIIDQFFQTIVEHIINTGLFKNEKAYQSFLRKVAILVTRDRVRSAAEKRDKLIVHAIETIDDIDKTLNLFIGRLREFYGMHFPELGDSIDNHYTFALIVSKTGNRKNITEKFLTDELNFPKNKAIEILSSREKTMGSNLMEQDIKIIQEQAQTVVDLYQRRNALEKWMEEAMKTTAPNICGVVGPLLGARLISIAGGLKDLAISPSSKIQVLGAEKALYRTIKTGAPPPKHGLIFQDPRINQAKWWLRGKIARIISGRISIAARMDYFEADDKSEELDKEVNEKITEIKDKYPQPVEKQRKTQPKKPSKKKPSNKYRKKKSSSKTGKRN